MQGYLQYVFRHPLLFFFFLRVVPARVDPAAVKDVSDLIAELKGHGSTVAAGFFSSVSKVS